MEVLTALPLAARSNRRHGCKKHDRRQKCTSLFPAHESRDYACVRLYLFRLSYPAKPDDSVSKNTSTPVYDNFSARDCPGLWIRTSQQIVFMHRPGPYAGCNRRLRSDSAPDWRLTFINPLSLHLHHNVFKFLPTQTETGDYTDQWPRANAYSRTS